MGFEPTVRFHARRFSRPVHSTTLPLLRFACSTPGIAILKATWCGNPPKGYARTFLVARKALGWRPRGGPTGFETKVGETGVAQNCVCDRQGMRHDRSRVWQTVRYMAHRHDSHLKSDLKKPVIESGKAGNAKKLIMVISATCHNSRNTVFIVIEVDSALY